MSEPLILSLFDTSSPGHDGALVVRGDRVERFAVHLPLSTDRDQLDGVGTRHAAALGLAERCDALCLVVSEERGSVAAARDGRLRALHGADELSRAMRRHLAGIAPETPPRRPLERLADRWPEALAALAIAAGLWLVRVPGSDVVEVERTASVRVDGLPDGYEVESIEPPAVRVRFSGTRWDLFRSRGQPVTVRIDALMAQLGRRTFHLAPGQVEAPPEIEAIEVEPANVKLSLRRTETADAAP